MAYVYKHVRLDKNEPFYIGISKNNDNYKRSKDKTGRNKIWKRIVKKTEYIVEIVFENDDLNLVNLKETEFIKLYGRIDLGTGTLCNLTDGSEKNCGFVPTTEFKENLRKRRLGKKHSPEKIKKMRVGVLFWMLFIGDFYIYTLSNLIQMHE
mgnify:CR=1 FL=1